MVHGDEQSQDRQGTLGVADSLGRENPRGRVRSEADQECPPSKTVLALESGTSSTFAFPHTKK